MRLCPGALARQGDKFRPLFGRQCCQKREGCRSQLTPKGTPLFSGLVEQLHNLRIVGVGLGQLGPSVGYQRFDRFVHLLHARPNSLSIVIKGRLLTRVEGELRLNLPQAFFRRHRHRRFVQMGPQRTSDKAQIEREG